MISSNSGSNIVYRDHSDTSSRYGYTDSTADPNALYADFTEKLRYPIPGAEPEAPTIVAPTNWLQAALAEADRKYGNMLRHLAE